MLLLVKSFNFTLEVIILVYSYSYTHHAALVSFSDSPDASFCEVVGSVRRFSYTPDASFSEDFLFHS